MYRKKSEDPDFAFSSLVIIKSGNKEIGASFLSFKAGEVSKQEAKKACEPTVTHTVKQSTNQRVQYRSRWLLGVRSENNP